MASGVTLLSQTRCIGIPSLRTDNIPSQAKRTKQMFVQEWYHWSRGERSREHIYIVQYGWVSQMFDRFICSRESDGYVRSAVAKVLGRQPIGACASSIAMPQPSRPRTGKRKKPPEEVPSSLSLEVVSLVRVGSSRGRATKKRIVEKFDFDPPSSPITFPDYDDDNTPPAPGSQVDPLNSTDDESVKHISNAASHSVSVGMLRSCHVTRSPSPLRRK